MPYILAGSLALLILTALAITSTRGWMRRLGRKWKRLHRLVYAAGMLAVLHFLWQAKAAEREEPLIYAAVLALLLLVRTPPVRRWLVVQRTRFTNQKPPLSHTFKQAKPVK
jgi:sulfoxide reductase heme-binding subunit YedZ